MFLIRSSFLPFFPIFFLPSFFHSLILFFSRLYFYFVVCNSCLLQDFSFTLCTFSSLYSTWLHFLGWLTLLKTPGNRSTCLGLKEYNPSSSISPRFLEKLFSHFPFLHLKTWPNSLFLLFVSHFKQRNIFRSQSDQDLFNVRPAGCFSLFF